MVWSGLKVFWLSKANPAGHIESKKKRWEDQKVDRNGLFERTRSGRKGLLLIQLWSPDNFPMLWDRIELNRHNPLEKNVEEDG